MLKDPSRKYRPHRPVALRRRTWPDAVIQKPPIWLSTDLRDGNQALFDPMSVEQKLTFFELLVKVGLKEIEVGFPSASETDFRFVRRLIEENRIPPGVRIQVLTQARETLIRRSFEALEGAREAIVHVYNATAPAFRRIVFGLDTAEVRRIAVDAADLMRELGAERPDTHWTFQYSPEVFSGTEPAFALECVDAVTETWQAGPDNTVIINLPATVEMSTPNVFADQIEWMHRRMARREGVVLSVHPHNDRGTAVAAAELAVMAGADRVEGCLFGNGERTGNVDLVTLALNLYTQGVDPGLDFSNINEVARTVETCTQLPIHPRHPYVGDLVFTAFSGSHQDAIHKGFKAQRPDHPWEVPYLPIDPRDLGRTYESIIRVNSQSGKGGVAHVLEREYDLAMPRRLQVEFSGVVQKYADDTGREVTPERVWTLFEQEFLSAEGAFTPSGHKLFDAGDRQGIRLWFIGPDQSHLVADGFGNGPIDALLDALAVDVQVQSYEERSLGQGADARAVAFVELGVTGLPGDLYGVGIDPNILTASIKAVFSGLNRAWARLPAANRSALWRHSAGRSA